MKVSDIDPGLDYRKEKSESETDLVDTLSWRLQGFTLIFESVSDYRKYCNTPPGATRGVVECARGP
jgi:hypothetical protein